MTFIRADLEVGADLEWPQPHRSRSWSHAAPEPMTTARTPGARTSACGPGAIAGWDAFAVGVACPADPATLWLPHLLIAPYTSAVTRKPGSLDDAVPRDNDGMDHRRRGYDQNAALLPVASGPLDGRERQQ